MVDDAVSERPQLNVIKTTYKKRKSQVCWYTVVLVNRNAQSQVAMNDRLQGLKVIESESASTRK